MTVPIVPSEKYVGFSALAEPLGRCIPLECVSQAAPFNFDCNEQFRLALDPCLIHDDVGYPIVTVRGLSNLTVEQRLISLPESRILAKRLDLRINSPHDIGSCGELGTSRSRSVIRTLKAGSPGSEPSTEKKTAVSSRAARMWRRSPS